MAISTLFDTPSSPEDFSRWSFAHMAHHRDINRVVFERVQVSLPEYPLDPMDHQAVGPWADLHQVMHNRQNAVLGIAGYNLMGIDWQNQDNLAQWIAVHANEHYRASVILNIG